MRGYIQALDGIRAFAILLVFVQHFAYFIGQKINAGFLGVDLFFVLSGYLITGILIQSKGTFIKRFRNFIGRRALRIFPLYYAVLLVLFILNTPGVREWGLYLFTYTYNYASVYYNIPHSPVVHFWSLSVEEQFYLLWPLLVLFLSSRKKWLFVCTSIIVLLCILQFSMNLFNSVIPYTYAGLYPRVYSLLIGAMGVIVFRSRGIPTWFKSKWFEFLLAMGLAACFTIQDNTKMILFPLVAVGIILKAKENAWNFRLVNSILNHRYAVYIGKISYGLYIYHLPLAYYFTEYIFTPLWLQIPFETFGSFKALEFHSWIIKLPLYTMLSIIVAHFSYKYFESYFTNLKDKYFA
ncbi:MAG TPA: acyltransferase [Ferruginibacter sp.]|nr:acyltransferase [Ferruginibacter sp.]HRO96013.1 acyltransferase [Ferruginibacter sp.]